MVFAPICPDRESDPPDSDSAGTPANSAPPPCLRGRRKRRRLRVWFSLDDQAVPLGEEECEEEIGCPDQGGAGGEGAKDKPRWFAAEGPGGWMDSTMALLDEGDQCITVGQLCPPTTFTVRIEVQGTPLEAVVDTGAEVTVLGAKVYNRHQVKPPVRKQVTMLQAGDAARLKGFISGPFDVKAGQSARQVYLYVAPLKDSVLLGMDFLWDHKANLELDAGTLCLGVETIRMTWGRSPVPREAQVTLIRKIKVPAGSTVSCPIRLDVGLGDFMVVPGVHLLSDTHPRKCPPISRTC